MKNHFQLKVADLFSRRHFEKAKVVAGRDGLQNLIKWVHVVEVANIKNLLNGNELILSTGVVLREDDKLFISMVKQLIECNAAGLCIEMGTYLSQIPMDAIDIANKHGLPIIIFEREVPFVEITQDIHTYIINQQYKMISDLEGYSEKLNKKLLTIDGYDEILLCLHEALQIPIGFRIKDENFIYVPEAPSFLKETNCFNDLPEHLKGTSIPIILFGQKYAELCMFTENEMISEYEHLILDRTATAMAQHLLRELFVEEKKKAKESEWLSNWLVGEHAIDTIQEYLTEHDAGKIYGGTVCICKYSLTKEKVNDCTYLKLLFRSALEQQGFTVCTIERRNEVIFILLNKRSKQNVKSRLTKAIDSIVVTDFMKKQTAEKIQIGIGKYYEHLTDIHKSYETALETIKIQKKFIQKPMNIFYEDLHLYRLISQMSKSINLGDLADEYLLPVIEHDQKTNGKLLKTLKTYLGCNCSKQETAKQLFIVRQTLYHRLEKLERLLGPDFMKPDKRIAIEFMLHVYEYLKSDTEKKEYEFGLKQKV